MRRRRGFAVRLLLALAIAAVACEVALRLAGTTDADGQFRVARLAVPPIRAPLRAIEASLARYRSSAEPYLVYDPDLGWAPRPGAQTRDGRARIDASGARAGGPERTAAVAGSGSRAGESHDGSSASAPAVIELFGDSFTFGDEVDDGETWGALLERTLERDGFAVDVLNFGVNAYGIDQAYLRWKKVGRALRPAVVIFGLQPENALRDLNVFRPLYYGTTEIPLSKPRFVLAGDELALVNSPALPPEQIVATIGALADHPLGAHERFFDADASSARWWRASRFLAFVEVALIRLGSGSPADPYAALAGESVELARRLVARFAAEVEADGGAFLVVYLPRREELELLVAGRPTWDAPLTGTIAQTTRWVDPTRVFAPLGAGDFRPAGHYAARLNAIVARELAARVGELLAARPAPMP